MERIATSKAVAQYKLASIWQLKGKAQRAIDCLLKAICLDPTFVPAYLECSSLMELNGKKEKAIELLKKGARLNPEESCLRSALKRLSGQKQLRSIALVESPIEVPPKNRKKILLYTDCSGVHGVEQNNLVLIDELLKKDYDVYCAQPMANNFITQKQKQLGVKHFWLNHDDIYNLKKIPHAFSNHTEPEKVISETNPDLIFFANGCPYSNLAAQETALKHSIFYITNIHCLNEEWFENYRKYTTRLRRVLNNAQKVIAVSKKNFEQLQHHLNWQAQNGMVIYNGRPSIYFKNQDVTKRREVRFRFKIPKDAVVCFTAARMEYVKGYQYQVAAMKELRKHTAWGKLFFLWAGTGSLEARLRMMAAEAGISDHIFFLGEVDNIPKILDASDIFILTSRFEGMPLSIIEAMAKGLSVIATAVGGTSEALGKTGNLLPDPLHAPQKTIKALTSLLKKLCEDFELRQKTGTACRKRAEAMFQLPAMKTAYLEQIDFLMHKQEDRNK
jgi:glycosyltransferase involved in cell wall biosynthesis